MHCRTRIRQCQTPGLGQRLISWETHNDSESEDIRRFVHGAFRMCFGAAPHPISQLCAQEVPRMRAMCTIFEIGELRLLNSDRIGPSATSMRMLFGLISNVCQPASSCRKSKRLPLWTISFLCIAASPCSASLRIFFVMAIGKFF
jgi:hypothetical protein